MVEAQVLMAVRGPTCHKVRGELGCLDHQVCQAMVQDILGLEVYQDIQDLEVYRDILDLEVFLDIQVHLVQAIQVLQDPDILAWQDFQGKVDHKVLLVPRDLRVHLNLRVLLRSLVLQAFRRKESSLPPGKLCPLRVKKKPLQSVKMMEVHHPKTSQISPTRVW